MISFSFFLMDKEKMKEKTLAFHAYHALTTYEVVIFNLSLLDFTLMS